MAGCHVCNIAGQGGGGCMRVSQGTWMSLEKSNNV